VRSTRAATRPREDTSFNLSWRSSLSSSVSALQTSIFSTQEAFASLCEDGSYLDGVFVFSYGTCVEGGPVVSGRKLYPEEGAVIDVTVYVTD
jgi:hypothetical protein